MSKRNLTRRALLSAALAAATTTLLPVPAVAQPAWPTKPIRIIIGSPPGSGTDVSARNLASRLSMVLGQPVIVENKAGAHGFIAGVSARDADKDGHTLLLAAGGTMAINPGLHGKRMPFDPQKDFVGIGMIEKGTVFLAVNNNLPIKNVQELVAWAKSQKQVNYGSGGNGTTSHLATELLERATGMKLTHVPYRGSAHVMQDLMGGQIQLAFDSAAVTVPLGRSGKIRLIGAGSAQRSAAMPEIPTIAEQGVPDFEALVWTGLYAPAGTPAPVVARLNEALNQVVRSPEFAESLKIYGSEPVGGSSEDLRKFLASETMRWTKLVKDANIQPD